LGLFAGAEVVAIEEFAEGGGGALAIDLGLKVIETPQGLLPFVGWVGAHQKPKKNLGRS
jgi:hypothetical protein